MSFPPYAEESAPLTTEPSSSTRGDSRSAHKDRRRNSNNNFLFFSSFTQKKQHDDSYNNSTSDNGSDNSDKIAGCTDYQHANPLRSGKYQGYCTLDTAPSADVGGGGRVSMHDDWDFSPRNSADSNDNKDDDGQFVSYWGQSSDDDDVEIDEDDRVETTVRPISLRYRQYQGGMRNSFSSNKDASHGNNNTFGNGDRNRRGENILLSLPIVRPFLRRSHQGFSDEANEFHSNHDEVDDDVDDDDCNNAPSTEDRAAVIKSISDGIAGTQSVEPMLLNNNSGAASNDNSNDPQSTQQTPPNLLSRIFLTRFIQVPQRNQEAVSLRQLHDLLRKEDWSLATQLIESKPMLARKWHSVKRLYGGKFDAEVLPIHSACALCPPASFIQTLATIYPESLLMKDQAFGRTPLHIACRSLADSSVIRVLCEMEPKSVVEKDSLKRVALHYLIKNCTTFGQDDDDDDAEDASMNNQSSANHDEKDRTAADGIVALKLMVETNLDCIKVADHRGWIPLHVACSCSARQGMTRVMKMLIDYWPEGVNAETTKNSDVFACVDMVGKHHATKDEVVALLKEARHALESCEDNETDGRRSSASHSIEVLKVPMHLGLDSLPEGQDDDAGTNITTKTEGVEEEAESKAAD